MTGKTITLTPALHDYLQRVSLREPPLLQRLRQETAALADANMQIAPEQGQLMGLLVRLISARKALEVGTYTGYSSLCLAMNLPADGRLIACDINPATVAIARRYHAEAGLADRIDIRLAPALETMDALLAAGAAGSFDFIFIDADKESYPQYLERSHALLRSGGLVLFDNVLWDGRVADPRNHESSTEGIRFLNQTLHADTRFMISMIPLADGVTLALKR
jgi:predicted O-methyltransferase YrrM